MRAKPGDICCRKFQVSRGSQSGVLVHQLQATAWPDHSVPDSPQLVLELVSEASRLTGSPSGVILVHCSAGVGRTGTFIAVYKLVEEFYDEK